SNSATQTVNATQTPALTLVKIVTETSYSAVGQTLHYSYLVTNRIGRGSCRERTEIEDKATVTCTAVTTVGNLDASLDPSEAVTCTATSTISQADLNLGYVTNVATAHAAATTSNTDSKTVTATQTPALTLVKSVTEASYNAVGQTLHYSYLVTN